MDQGLVIGPRSRAVPDSAHWNIPVLDTAKDIPTLSPLEKDVILEMNMVRINPGQYAEQYIRPRLALFSGLRYCPPGNVVTMTDEGIVAVSECIAAMNGAEPAGLLVPMKGLWLAAKDHAADQSANGRLGHSGSDGSTPQTRIARHGKFSGPVQAYGENISYGPVTGREIVCSLLIDDGVPDRGHRHNIFQKAYTQCAASCMTHPVYRFVCVITYATGYISNIAHKTHNKS